MSDAIGELNHYVQIQSRTTSTDSFGEVVQTGWTTVANAWCRILSVGSKEIMNAANIENINTHRMYFRFDTPITVEQRIQETINGTATNYNISGIKDLMGNREWLEVEATEETD